MAFDLPFGSGDAAHPHAPFILAGLLLASLCGLIAACIPPLITVYAIAIGAACLVSALTILAFGLSGLSNAFMFLAAGSLGLTAIRINDWMTVSDAFLVLAAAATLAAPGRRLSVSLESGLTIGGLLLICVGGVLGAMWAGQAGAGFTQVLRFSVASIGLIVLVQVWQPSQQVLRATIGFWVLSAVLSALYAFGFQLELASFRRVMGLAVHPNHFSTVAFMALGAAMAFSGKTGKLQGAFVAAVAILSIAVLLSGSRSGILGVAVVTLAVVLSNRQTALLSWLAVAAVVLVIVVASGRLSLPENNSIDRLISDNNASAAESNDVRREYLQENLHRINQSPFFGSGFEYSRQANNIYIQIWSSAGVLGLLGMVLVLAGVLTKPLVSFIENTASIETVALASATLGFFAAGLFQNQLWDRYIWLVIGLAIFAAAAPRESVKTRDVTKGVPNRKGPVKA